MGSILADNFKWIKFIENLCYRFMIIMNDSGDFLIKLSVRCLKCLVECNLSFVKLSFAKNNHTVHNLRMDAMGYMVH